MKPEQRYPPLPRQFYSKEVVEVARQSLGKLLIRTSEAGLTTGRIVEVEAYLASRDPASHASRGRTRRNASMFGVPGHAYVYAIHARYCLNLVTEPEDVPSAVLIRAVEPLEGIALMRERRGRMEDRNLTSGPARLCEAFAIDRTYDGWDLVRGAQLWLSGDDHPPGKISVGPRVGVTSAKRRRLRFYWATSVHVSRR